MNRPSFLDEVAEQLGDRSAFRALARGSFQPPHVEPQWPRDRVADIRHIAIEIALDFDAGAISGTVTHRLAAIGAGLDHLEFDQAELTIEAVRVGGRTAQFVAADGKLTVRLETPLGAGAEAEVAIDYRARPRRGLYFVRPDASYPGKPLQAWTQGEDEDSRYWFPCYDYPNDKATSEVIATVPERMTAVSNGALVAVTADAGARTRTFHWRQDVPHSSYLIALSAGEFATIEERAGSTPVLYYVTPGREDDARRAFGNTPRMIAFYERVIGVPYPYAKYAQVAVADFIFGGMENTSATIQTADTLHDARAHLDFSSDPLVAHELAHQWWGDLVTCRDWSHAWLNEGFATYFEALWCEENLGADEFAWNLRQDRANYFDEARNYMRPIVCNRYRAPIELFDRHLYEKGSLVLHMLRRTVADDALFFAALRLYCTRHRGQNVVTQDLQKAFEDATGRNLDYFFEQWVYREGHPELEVTSAWDDKRKSLGVTVKQTHKVPEATPAFRFPVAIAMLDENGGERRHLIEVREREQTFHFPCEAAPRAVRFDPAHDVLMLLKHKRGREALELELTRAPEAIGRAAAARELGREGSPAACAALRKAMLEDRFWGVQAEAAAALGTIRTAEALKALLEAIDLPHPKARRGVMRALGEFRSSPEAADALIAVLERGDLSYFVEAEAALALGRTRDPRALDVLTRMLERDSHVEVLRAHALAGMAQARDDRAVEIAMAQSRYGARPRARVAAVGALGRLAALKETRREEIVDFLAPLADDPEFMVRMRLPGAFEEIGDARALEPLRRLADRDLDGRVRRRAQEAISSINEGRSRSQEARRMREDIEHLSDDARKLRERLDKLESAARGPSSKPAN